MYKKINFTKKQNKRKVIEQWENKDYLLNEKNHISMINQIFLNETFVGSKTVRKELQKKINSYKQQDIKKNKNSDGVISYEDLVEKIVVSKLHCYYCKQKMLLLYENNRDEKQWTLDRLDNSIGHIKDNVVISCLKCNMERRCINDKKFLFTKQMRLIKKK